MDQGMHYYTVITKLPNLFQRCQVVLPHAKFMYTYIVGLVNFRAQTEHSWTTTGCFGHEGLYQLYK